MFMRLQSIKPGSVDNNFGKLKGYIETIKVNDLDNNIQETTSEVINCLLNYKIGLQMLRQVI